MKIAFQLRTKDMDVRALLEEFKGVDFGIAWTLDEVVREIADAEVFVTNSRVYDAAMVRAVNANAKRLKWIHFVTSGIDGPVRAGGFPDGVVVTNSAGLRAPNLSEHVFAMLLFMNRRLRAIEKAREVRTWIRDDIWNDIVALTGQTLCIVGMGAIGQAVVPKAKAFGMKIIAVSRGFEAGDGVDAVYPRDRVKEALAKADVVLLSMPSDSSTRNFMDADKLAAMKKSAYLLNISRGDLIDEEALIATMKARAIQGAALDVTRIEPNPADNVLWALDNVFITPHVGGAGSPDDRALIEVFAVQLRRYLAGKPLQMVVDWRTLR